MSGIRRIFDFGKIFTVSPDKIEQVVEDGARAQSEIEKLIAKRERDAYLGVYKKLAEKTATPPPGEPMASPPMPPALLHDSKIPVSIIPIICCTECSSQYQSMFMDAIRVKFVHHVRDGCSKSNTYFIRPKAAFTHFL